MKLVLATNSSNADYNGDCDFAIVELTPELAALVIRRVELLKQVSQSDKQAYELYFWDYHCTFFDASLDEKLDVEEILEVPDTFEVPEDKRQPTECDQMVISVSGVKWSVIPKHSDVYVTTSEIPLERFTGEKEMS